MSKHGDNSEQGIVYHIDVELMRKARERQLQKNIKQIDTQIKNAENDLMIFKTAENALAKIESLLRQMRALAVEANTNPKADRKALNKQLEALKKQVNSITESASYSGVNLINGSMGNINDIIAAVTNIINENERR